MSWIFSGLLGGGAGSVAAAPGYDGFSSPPPAVSMTLEGRVVAIFRKPLEKLSDERKHVFLRERATAAEPVMVDEWGMQGSSESHRGKRWDLKLSPLKTPKAGRDRAVSVQSAEHYVSLRSSHPEVDTLQHAAAQLLGTFGENMAVDGVLKA